jgi:hypothetical protein
MLLITLLHKAHKLILYKFVNTMTILTGSGGGGGITPAVTVLPGVTEAVGVGGLVASLRGSCGAATTQLLLTSVTTVVRSAFHFTGVSSTLNSASSSASSDSLHSALACDVCVFQHNSNSSNSNSG